MVEYGLPPPPAPIPVNEAGLKPTAKRIKLFLHFVQEAGEGGVQNP